ncbi:sugar (Glycoside-Pentoside-Hexuronide) transporter [Bacillus cereus BAG6X1-2]|nr:sugar (Glycoside-Pentoside-Hexuronide) transporter [Bacillus cereus BAG6X1-2]
MLAQEDKEQPSNFELEKPRKKEMWAYGLASYGIFSIWTLIGTFLTFYYTEIVGLTGTVVGTLMLVARIFGGVTDIGMGIIIDNTNSKYGKSRPWLLWMTLPFCISTVFLFSVPNIGKTEQIIYAYVTYMLFIIAYTAVSIPYKTLLGLMTRHQHSRSLSNIYSSILTLSGTIFVVILTQPISKVIGWPVLVSIYALLSMVTIYGTFHFTKERVGSNEEKVSTSAGVKALFKNKYWLIITAYAFTYFAMHEMITGIALYYATWILEDGDIFPLLGLSLMIPMILGVFMVGGLASRIGKRNTVLIGCILIIISSFVKMMNPYDLSAFIIGTIITGLGFAPTSALLFAMTSDTAEYGEYKTGQRTIGLVNSGLSFGIKVGSGLGLALIGWLLGYGGYVGGASKQTSLALQMIIALNIYIPLALAIIMILLLLLFNLDKQYSTILAELYKRKS